MFTPLRFFKEISFRDSRRVDSRARYEVQNLQYETLFCPVTGARRSYTTDTLNILYIVLTILL